MQNTPKRPSRVPRAPKATPTLPPPRHVIGPRPATVRLIERIVELQLRQVPLETFATEMVPLLLDAMEAPAGALLLYHCDSESLGMIGWRGLSPTGRMHLDSLRRGAADSWEIPLHGLLNRKAYIIERPDEHPFVPELVSRETMPRALNLASIPLYRGQLPVGVLLAIADRRPIAESEILAHVLAFDALALALDGYVRARAVPLGAPEAAAVASAEPAPEGAAKMACEAYVDPREVAARLEAELGGEHAARDALAMRLAESETRLATATAALSRAAEERTVLLAGQEKERADAAAAERERGTRTLEELRTLLAARDATIASRDIALAERDATIAETAAEAERARTALIEERDRVRASLTEERERIRTMLTEERDRARAAAAASADLVRELRGSVAVLEGEREALRAAHDEAAARRDAVGMEAARLGDELAALRAEASRLLDERARVLAAVDEPGAEPAAVIRALREKVASLESEIGAHAGERAALARRAATQAEQVAEQLAAQRRELDELRAAHARAVAEIRAAHGRELADARAAHERAFAAAVGTLERGQAEVEERHQATLAALRAEHAEMLERAVAERDARQLDVERLSVERDDLEGRLAWALAEREEAAAAASVRERAAIAGLESARRDAAIERAGLEEQRATLERARAEDVRRLAGLEHEIAVRDDRAAALARDLEDRDAQLAASQAELARLREDRERVLAVVDDPGAEPAAVIQALRERVASYEAQVRAAEQERAQAAERVANEIEQAEHRVALQRRELAEVRAEHRSVLEEVQSTFRRDLEQARAEHRREREADAASYREEIAKLRDVADRLDAERRATLVHVERDRDAALASARDLRAAVAARDATLSEREQALAALAAEQARLSGLAGGTAGELERTRATVAALDGERGTLRARVEALAAAEDARAAQLDALAAERDRQLAARLESDARAEQLATELAIIQAEVLRLREDRARVLAAVDDDGAEPAAVVRALREQVAAIEGQLAAHAAERVEVGRRAAAEARAAEERLAIARAERDAADAEHRRALEAAQAAHARTLEETAVAHRQALEDAVAAQRNEIAEAARTHTRALAERAAEIARLEAERLAALADAAAARAALAAAEQARETALTNAERARATAVAAEQTRAAAAVSAPPPPPPAVLNDMAADAAAAAAASARARTLSSVAETPPPAEAPPPIIEVVQRDGHHILESDAARWERIHAALAELPPAPGRNLMVANLLAAFPAGLYDLTAAATAGATLVGYAADAHNRSCILGAVRCFVDPPTAAEASAVLDAMPKGPRRVLTLSEDVEAFLGAKIGLAKAGHSVSMACEAKQAIDLLAMLTPDAVFIDLRTAPTAAAEFLAALAPENGRVVVVLVHGDPAGNILPCVIQRLLRAKPLDLSALVQTCRAVLDGPPSATTPRSAPVKAIRPLERPPVVAPRKPTARRLIPRRR